VLLDRAARENAHPDVLPDRPLCDIAIRIARMIREPTDPAALSGIDELRQSRLNRHQIGPTTHLVLLQHHKIEMLDALFPILPHPLDKCRIRNDVANVFVNERIPVVSPTSCMRQSPSQTKTCHSRTLSCPPQPATRTPFSPFGQYRFPRILAFGTFFRALAPHHDPQVTVRQTHRWFVQKVPPLQSSGRHSTCVKRLMQSSKQISSRVDFQHTAPRRREKGDSPEPFGGHSHVMLSSASLLRPRVEY
jgi:hypothetical protein